MSQKKWAHDIGVQIDDCRYMYPSSELQSFQFKLSYRITATNSFLFKCGLKETELCTFCKETKKSLLHLFWECIYSKKKNSFH